MLLLSGYLQVLFYFQNKNLENKKRSLNNLNHEKELFKQFLQLASTRVGPDIWSTFDIRKITGYPAGYLALNFRQISGIKIVSISGIRPDIENSRISGRTGYPAQPYNQ